MTEIVGVSGGSTPDSFVVLTTNFETFDEVQSALGIEASNRDAHSKATRFVQQQTELHIRSNDLERYYAKRKDLKGKHIQALLNLVRSAKQAK